MKLRRETSAAPLFTQAGDSTVMELMRLDLTTTVKYTVEEVTSRDNIRAATHLGKLKQIISDDTVIDVDKWTSTLPWATIVSQQHFIPTGHRAKSVLPAAVTRVTVYAYLDEQRCVCLYFFHLPRFRSVFLLRFR